MMLFSNVSQVLSVCSDDRTGKTYHTELDFAILRGGNTVTCLSSHSVTGQFRTFFGGISECLSCNAVFTIMSLILPRSSISVVCSFFQVFNESDGSEVLVGKVGKECTCLTLINMIFLAW